MPYTNRTNETAESRRNGVKSKPGKNIFNESPKYSAAGIIDAAKYILHTKNKCTTMKLHRLCYYAQAWTLAWDCNPLFDDDFAAGAAGPVSPVLQSRHKDMFVLRNGDLGEYDPLALTDRQRQIIDRVIEHFWQYEPHELLDLVRDEAPWKIARLGVKPGFPSVNVIRKSDIQIYYAGLMAEGASGSPDARYIPKLLRETPF